MKHWHLLMTKPRDEERAQQHLLNQHYEIFRPLIRQFRIRKGKQVAVTEALFPRYIFIRLDDVLGNWSTIRSTRGVAGLVRFSEMPAVVPDSLFEEIRGRVDAENILDATIENACFYKPGDKVEVTGGSFRGLPAIVKAQNGEERVILLLELLGKQHTLDMPLEQIVLLP